VSLLMAADLKRHPKSIQFPGSFSATAAVPGPLRFLPRECVERPDHEDGDARPVRCNVWLGGIRFGVLDLVHDSLEAPEILIPELAL
jgi:hypothetical protein